MSYFLYHYPLCVFSRQIRILLKELRYNVSYYEEKYWLKSEKLLSLNPAAELPILKAVDSDLIIAGIYPTLEYLIYLNRNWSLFNQKIHVICEIRRLITWFNNKMYFDVTSYIFKEKLIKLLSRDESPDAKYLRIARKNLKFHLEYITKLILDRSFLACDKISIADIVAASHISTLDYFGEIEWNKYVVIKEWYSLIKSRPSFKSLLLDRIIEIKPPSHYKLLDF